MHKDKKIIIVGAGLCGSLLALRLAQRGFRINLYEKRSDMRKGIAAAGRSINLALSARGLLALERVGIKDQVLKECIPMKGRMIHPLDGEAFLSPYSGRKEDYINSVSRSGLNIRLLNEAEKLSNIEIKFNCPVSKVNLKEASIVYTDPEGGTQHDQGEVVIGTDGAGSVVRKSMLGKTTSLLFNYSQDFLRHGYKELSILPTEEGGWKIFKEALHIWPRGNFMIIALPNLDGSFTLTMFHPYDSAIGFNALDTAEKLGRFFEEYYPSLLPFIPHYQEEYFINPVGNLGTIKCSPWQAYGKTLIMGDASHAIVPFYGQGMNASFEDVRVFDDLFEKYGDDWSLLFNKFQESRIENANAIADLAKDNFHEMRDKVDDIPFIRKRKLEMQLEQTFPEYYSKYSLVTFKPHLDYSEAKNLGRKQDALLLEICSQDDYETLPLETVFRRLAALNS